MILHEQRKRAMWKVCLQKFEKFEAHSGEYRRRSGGWQVEGEIGDVRDEHECRADGGGGEGPDEVPMFEYREKEHVSVGSYLPVTLGSCNESGQFIHACDAQDSLDKES